MLAPRVRLPSSATCRLESEIASRKPWENRPENDVNGDTVDTVRPVFQLVEWRQGEDSQLKLSLPSVTVGRDATIEDIKCQVAAGLNLLGISSTLSGEGHGSIHPLPHEDDDDKILSGGSRHYGVSLGFEALKKLGNSLQVRALGENSETD